GDRGDRARRGAVAFDLSDHTDAVLPQRRRRLQWRWNVRCALLQLIERQCCLTFGEVLANPVENLLECTQQPTSLTADPAVSPTGWGAISLTDTVLFPRQACYPARRSPSGVGQRIAWHGGELPLLARSRIVPRGAPVPPCRVRITLPASVCRSSVTRAESRHSTCQTDSQIGRAACRGRG